MGIPEAVAIIEEFLAGYRSPRVWNPREVRVLPSGDHLGHIKLWFDFGPGVTGEELAELERQPLGPLLEAHPELAEFTLEVRSESI